MSEQKTAVVDPITNIFCSDGMAAGRIIINVPDNPDAINQRYSGDPLSPFRAATPTEISSAAAIVNNNNAASAIDSTTVMKAAMICGLWGRLGRQPTALEIVAERTRFINIYKTL